MPRPLLVLSILGLCLITAAARVWNVRDIFVQGRIYFVDADCYSRMTRARMVANGHLVIRHHDFENWPTGTEPHTTAPLDWAIVATKRALHFGFRVFDRGATSLLYDQTLDLAGAIISPLFGVLTCAFLAWWSLRLRMPGGIAPAVLFAISPILVHGTVLGRPDHQSFLILLAAVAMVAELELARRLTKHWAIVAGAAWGLGLWISFYEPLVLLVIVSAFWLVCDRRRFLAPEVRAGWITFGVILITALAVDGWRVSWPDPALRASFASWKSTVGELAHLDPRTPLLYRWLGALIPLAPIGLALAVMRARGRGEAESTRMPSLCVFLLLATFALTVWQLRWGYFLGLAFALSLPWVFTVTRRRWIAWPIFLLSLWPLAQDWDEKLFPDDHPELEFATRRSLLRLEAVRLREVAEAMRSAERRPFIAPWWLSPALAYWSGQPGVAGSSHQSLPGIVTTARFFLAPDAPAAEKMVRDLGVKWVVTDDPDRLLATSRDLLNQPASTGSSFVAHLHEIAEPRERVSAEDLRTASPGAREKLGELADRAEAAQLGSAVFSCISTNQFYKLFSIRDVSNKP
jgi:hypothetical protein